ncbi:uncharacterized protein LOC131945080 [Physella acuta]|uniref:uncharacterized protein LOC131945080 n=1 Tax=Physella acuta TaxID=109671 RepID=UPI0027DE7E4A|nr:uncharacterized protein LOC131945080 [Physella acuta]
MQVMYTNMITAIMVGLLGIALASELKFESNPSNIHPILTKTLQVRCAVKISSLRIQGSARLGHGFVDPSNAKIQQNATAIQRNNRTQNTTTSPTPHSQLLTGNQSTSTPPHVNDDVSHITSIIISKEVSGHKVTVASVTAFDSPSIESPFTGIVSVEGNSNTSPVTGEQGYLQLRWEEPLAREAGVYTCEVFGLNTDKHPVSLYDTVQVQSSEPTYTELIAYISAFDKALSELQKENKELRMFQSNITADISEMGTKLYNLTGPEIQTGRVSCLSTTVNFQSSFSKTPVVYVSLSGFRTSSSPTSGLIEASIRSIANSYFYLDCSMSGFYNTPTVSWIAIC